MDKKSIGELRRRLKKDSCTFTKMCGCYVNDSKNKVIKLDETSSAGSILNVRVETKCPLSYVTWGQNVPDDIGEIDAQKIAKQLLGGKE